MLVWGFSKLILGAQRVSDLKRPLKFLLCSRTNLDSDVTCSTVIQNLLRDLGEFIPVVPKTDLILHLAQGVDELRFALFAELQGVAQLFHFKAKWMNIGPSEPGPSTHFLLNFQ